MFRTDLVTWQEAPTRGQPKTSERKTENMTVEKHTSFDVYFFYIHKTLTDFKPNLAP